LDVTVSLLSAPAVASLPLEIVERKGVGHPDTICDALAESLSVALSRFHLERFGAILHHNVDKALLRGGAARPMFGGGEILDPIEIYLTGRATATFRGVAIPIDELAIESSRQWLKRHLRFVDPDRHVRLIPRIRPTSPDLAALFLRQAEDGAPLANDTSFGVGFAPLDDLERIVLAAERHLNSQPVKQAHPEIGEDIKVMGARRDNGICLTVACALVDRHIRDMDAYRTAKARVRALVLEAARPLTPLPVDVQVNTADGATSDSIYLTVTGVSAEAGDDGQVGRGNRVNGLITPYRPMSLEAAAGKNPITHVGKLYSVMANRVAQAVVDQVSGVDEVYCYLLSCIGCPITEPQVFDVKARLADPSALAALAPRILEVARTAFVGIDLVWREAVAGTLQVW
jgi:S-adenosylmethionine synthetase